jgi:hypothetical protein
LGTVVAGTVVVGTPTGAVVVGPDPGSEVVGVPGARVAGGVDPHFPLATTLMEGASARPRPVPAHAGQRLPGDHLDRCDRTNRDHS